MSNVVTDDVKQVDEISYLSVTLTEGGSKDGRFVSKRGTKKSWIS